MAYVPLSAFLWEVEVLTAPHADEKFLVEKVDDVPQ